MTGDEEWYTWTAERKEMFVPYNNYRMAQPGLTMDDIVRPGHVNSDLIRYELHLLYGTNISLRSAVHTYHSSSPVMAPMCFESAVRRPSELELGLS